MIDVSNITNYNYSYSELEELILFWILAAGKNGKTASICLERLLISLGKEASPFQMILSFGYELLPERMKNCGIGCYNGKAKTIWDLVHSNLDLTICSCDDLEKIKGIGCKTSRGFIVHSRKIADYAVIDRHLLSYLKTLGYDVPLSTPSNKKTYSEIEKLFLSLIPFGFTVSSFDLLIWRVYSGN